MNKNIKLIRKWAKLRHSDKKFADVAIRLYETSDERDREMMVEEFQDYVDAVKDGIIQPTSPKIPIKIFKNGKSST